MKESLYHPSMPQEELRTVVNLLIFTYFGSPTVLFKQLSDLGHAVNCIVRAFIQI